MGKTTVDLSSSALRHLWLRKLADTALGRYWGGLACCGPANRFDGGLLMNLAKSWGVSVGFAEPFGDATRRELEGFRSRGYMLTSGPPEHVLAELPKKPNPMSLSFLLVKDGAAEAAERMAHRIAPGSVVVCDGGAETRDALERLASRHGWVEFEELPAPEGGPPSVWTRPMEARAEEAEAEPDPTAPTVLCYPNSPGGRFRRMCQMAGYRVSRDPTQGFDLAIKWLGETYTPNDRVLEELAQATRVINFGCDDISKTRVEAVHQQVFGYGLIVDPKTYQGPAVVKSNMNARGGEDVVECPVEIDYRPYVVYQRRVTTPREPDEFEEYRVAVTGQRLATAVVKRRPLSDHFDRSAGYALITEPDEVLSAAEQAKVLELCTAVGLEFGDLDILREQGDGRIHVIDVNPTPGGPGGGYTEEQRQRLVGRQLEIFRQTFSCP